MKRVSFAIEGALHPGYDLVRQPISNLELVPNGWTQSANFILFGLFIICFAFGLRKEFVRGVGTVWIPLLQGLVALGLIISGVFIHDPLHTSGDILSFSAAFVNCFVFARRFAMDTRWRGWATYTIVTGVLMMLFIIAFGVAQSQHGPAGLFERLAIIVRSIWTILLAARLLARPGSLLPTRPQMAFCRCGESANKPFCDGTHARIGFTAQKDPKRVPDRRDTYIGTAITVLDNRGICAHSGFCTDRLASVFHVGDERFVTPNGARMDEVIRAVRACPSGALSYALGESEIRDGVDQARPPAIEVSKDEPYRVTGGIALKDWRGNDEPRNTGASLEHYSLCRCGHSQNKPFCSGMHWYVNFHDPQVDVEHEPTLFEWVGGLPALTRMTHLFYDKYIPQDPLLLPLFVGMAPDHPEPVAAWLGEVFGEPKNYSQQYGGYPRMLSQHVGKQISEAQREHWVSLLCQAADEAGVPADAEFRSAFMAYIEWGSHLTVENSASHAHPPLHMPMPHWNWGTAGPPGSRVSALAPVQEEEKTVALPSADEPVRFSLHIKPLFRLMDRQSMSWAFDLWSYKDVAAHAESILQRLQKGSMPCDGAWSHEKVETFQRWVESGTQE